MSVEHVFFWREAASVEQIARAIEREFETRVDAQGESRFLTSPTGWTAIHSTAHGARLHVHDDPLADKLVEQGWVLLPELWSQMSDGERQRLAIEHLICHQRTEWQTVTIAETLSWDTALFLDDELQSASGDEVLYHESLVRPIMSAHSRPRRVLICGAGEGASAREVLRFDAVEELVVVDIDGELCEIVREHLSMMHDDALLDPRVRLEVADITQFLPDSGPWDVIIGDLSDPSDNGLSNAGFRSEFYLAARRELADQGLFVTQAGESDSELNRSVLEQISEAFSSAIAYNSEVPSFGARWGFVRTGPLPGLRHR